MEVIILVLQIMLIRDFKIISMAKEANTPRANKPLKLVYQQEFATKSEALKREFQLKQWSRAKKDILIQSVISP